MRRLLSLTWILIALAALAVPVASQAQVICASNVNPPPELPVYEQPPIPAPGYIWSPGYWGGGPAGYYWVPGTWVEPPTPGLLWTPGYWAWRDGIYTWSAGYWGPHIGFYGGINYGFGYVGVGYEGGRWENGVFLYNRTVNNFGGVTIVNVYEKPVVVDPAASRVSFQGGTGGTTAKPTPQEEAAVHEQHVAAGSAQLQHERAASTNKALLASANHGRPLIAATSKPGEFKGKGVVAAAKPGTTLPEKRAVGTKPAGTTTVGVTPANIKAEKEVPAANTQPKTPTRTPSAVNSAGPKDEKLAPGARDEKKKPAATETRHETVNAPTPPKPVTAAKPVTATPPTAKPPKPTPRVANAPKPKAAPKGKPTKPPEH